MAHIPAQARIPAQVRTQAQDSTPAQAHTQAQDSTPAQAHTQAQTSTRAPVRIPAQVRTQAQDSTRAQASTPARARTPVRKGTARRPAAVSTRTSSVLTKRWHAARSTRGAGTTCLTRSRRAAISSPVVSRSVLARPRSPPALGQRLARARTAWAVTAKRATRG
jgi:hypothetical protein